MWMASCRRQGMLTEGPAPGLNCKLIFSSFLTLPIYQIVSFLPGRTCLLFTNDGGWGGWWVVDLYQDVGRGQGVGTILQFLFHSCPFVFCCLTFSVSLCWWLEHNGCYVCFFVFFLIFFVSDPFIQELLGQRNCCVCCVKLFQKSVI